MFKYIGIVIRILPLLIWNYLTWIIYYSHHKDKIPLEKKYNKLRKFLIKVLKRLHVDLNVSGLEYLNDGQIKMITPNHQSLLDPLLLIALSEKPITFIAKKEVEKMPVAGRVFKIIDGQFLDRNDLHQQIKILRIMDKSLINKEHSWVIFPEGTRNKDIENVLINEFHPGTFKTALKEDVLVLPIVIEGVQKVLSTKIWKRKYVVNISILKPQSNNEVNAQNSTEYRDYVYNLMCDELKTLKQNNLLKNS